MRRYVRYDPFDIYCFEASEWIHPTHNHTYFEIIFIREGNGWHILNDNTLPYRKGDIFLLGPEDYHHFNIETPTTFAFIRFTESFFKEPGITKHKNWQQVIDALFTSEYKSNGSIVKHEEEKRVLDNLLTVLIYEYQNRQSEAYEVIIESLMRALSSILIRNLIQQTTPEDRKLHTAILIEKLLIYIRQNISRPDMLKMERLSEEFNYSPTYLSTYFKRQVGDSLQHYILKYKLSLVANALQNSNKTISSISFEYGFTDESHLSKIFRKYYGRSPGNFRKNKAY
jgi:AraC family L-rhamnose operon regulatory protein RhaS